MAIAYGGHTEKEDNLATSGSTTLTAPTISGSDTVLFCIVAANASSTVGSDPTATYNSVSLGAPDWTDYIDYKYLSVWIVVNPASAQDFVASNYNTSNTYKCEVACVYYTGVDQSTTYRTVPTPTKGSDTPGTIDITSSQTNDLIIGIFGLNDTTNTNGMTEARVGSGQTFRFQYTNSSDEASLSVCEETGASGTVTTSWAFVNNAYNGWVAVAVPLIPAATATDAMPWLSAKIRQQSFDLLRRL